MVVLVQIESLKVLRQFIWPNILLKNWAGPKVAVGLDDSSVRPKIVGVVLQKRCLTFSQVLMDFWAYH
jgi:hypothetical protein